MILFFVDFAFRCILTIKGVVAMWLPGDLVWAIWVNCYLFNDAFEFIRANYMISNKKRDVLKYVKILTFWALSIFPQSPQG